MFAARGQPYKCGEEPFCISSRSPRFPAQKSMYVCSFTKLILTRMGQLGNTKNKRILKDHDTIFSFKMRVDVLHFYMSFSAYTGKKLKYYLPKAVVKTYGFYLLLC